MILRTQPFVNWYKDKTGKNIYEERRSLKEKDINKLYLVWKWGDLSENALNAFESTRRELLFDKITPQFVAKMTGDRKEYFKNMLIFEEECNQVKELLGLPSYRISGVEKKYTERS